MCEIYLTFRVLVEYLRLPTPFFFLIKMFLFNLFLSRILAERIVGHDVDLVDK